MSDDMGDEAKNVRGTVPRRTAKYIRGRVFHGGSGRGLGADDKPVVDALVQGKDDDEENENGKNGAKKGEKTRIESKGGPMEARANVVRGGGPATTVPKPRRPAPCSNWSPRSNKDGRKELRHANLSIVRRW